MRCAGVIGGGDGAALQAARKRRVNLTKRMVSHAGRRCT
jgi:hypothetical protein